MIIRNTNPFEYYIIQQLFNDVNVPRCHTENLSYENIFIPFKCTFLLFSRFYFLRHKYKRHDFLRAGAFAPVSPLPPQPRACFLNEFFIIWENVFVKTPSLLISPLLLSKLIFTSNSTFLKYVQFENNDFLLI